MTRWRRPLLIAAAWLIVALPAWGLLFTHTGGSMSLASHDVVLTPTFDGHAVFRMGPYLPDVRMPANSLIGVRIVVGKTTADSTQELVARYGVIASRPQAEVRRVHAEVTRLALAAGLRAAVIGLVPVGLWLLVGPLRRRDLLGTPRPRLAIAAVAAGALGVALWQPWTGQAARVQATDWIPLQKAVPQVTIPAGLTDLQMQGGLITSDTQRLVQSAFDTYAKSKTFYAAVEAQAPDLAGLLHQPDSGETVGVLVSDRHDNIGMDHAVAAIAKQGGATVVIDAGDDTSTGGAWEAFSLDSLDEAFEDFSDRIAVAGNHDNGSFVSNYLSGLGWTHLDGEAVTKFGVRLFGVDDPRSSGLGSWRDEHGLSFDQVGQKLSDEVCRLDKANQRVGTVIVHYVNLALPALDTGCTDLVVGGHLHVQVGPDRVVGTNGKVGYSYTNGTTGGAAFSFALGSKLRRDAEFTLITWRNGRPIGIQPVTVKTTGKIKVHRYLALTY